MNSRSMKAIKAPMSVRELIELSLMGALLIGTQVAMSALPNINLISVLIILSVMVYGVKAFYPIYVFVLLEGLIYGFGLWFFNYLYVWAILALVALILRKNTSYVVWAVLAGIFGLSFGALCAIPYFFIGGPAMALSYWVSGIPFDITHCVSNFVLTLLLLKPLHKLFMKYHSKL